MKNKSLPAVFAIVLLLILTCLTVVFVADYYSAFGDQFSNTIYETNGRSPLYGTKALDAESVQFGIERAEALKEFPRYSLPVVITPDNSSDAGSGIPVPDDRTDRDPEILYVVYCESLKSGGF